MYQNKHVLIITLKKMSQIKGHDTHCSNYPKISKEFSTSILNTISLNNLVAKPLVNRSINIASELYSSTTVCTFLNLIPNHKIFDFICFESLDLFLFFE